MYVFTGGLLRQLHLALRLHDVLQPVMVRTYEKEEQYKITSKTTGQELFDQVP